MSHGYILPPLFLPLSMQPSAVIQEVESGSESESDESHYSGLESERDTDIEDLEVRKTCRGSQNENG